MFMQTARVYTMYHFHLAESPDQPNPFEADYQKLVLDHAFSSRPFVAFAAHDISGASSTVIPDRMKDPLDLRRLWAPDPPSLGTSRTVVVDPNTAEYAFVAARFRESLPEASLGQVRRVESPGQLEGFEARVRAAEAGAGAEWGRADMVRWLFHGTSAAAAERIAAGPVVGFRAAMNQRSAAGRGIYFASDAALSHKYAVDGTMIMSAVVICRPMRCKDYGFGAQSGQRHLLPGLLKCDQA